MRRSAPSDEGVVGAARLWFGRALDGALALILATVVGIAFAQTVLRYALADSWLWVEELSVILMVWFTAFGVARAWLADAHVALPLLPAALSPRARVGLLRLFDGLAIAGGIALALAALPLVEVYASIRLDTMPASAAVKYAPLIAAGVLLAVAAGLRLLGRRADG